MQKAWEATNKLLQQESGTRFGQQPNFARSAALMMQANHFNLLAQQAATQEQQALQNIQNQYTLQRLRNATGAFSIFA